MARSLDVWLYGSRVGSLSQDKGRLSFAYLPQASVPLSQSLPIRAEPFDDRATRAYFAGLLPEGANRRQIAKTLQISVQNDYALLDLLGGECAGAVTLLPPGQPPRAPSGPQDVRWLDEAQLRQVLSDMPIRPMRACDAGLRLSLAGAQDKLPVVLGADGLIGLPLNGSPSTHILKPPISGIEGSVFNEAFCMTLAATFQLDTAPVQIQTVADRTQAGEFLLVQRYDRPSEQPGMRLHQEDFCQALGMPSEHKYQNEGGPSLPQAFALLRSATRPSAPHTLKLLDFVVFNALIGNHDAHGKNFSLLYRPSGAALAPVYDALSTAVYPTLTDKMAMKIGSKYRFTEVQVRHWEQLAELALLSYPQVKKRLLGMAHRLPNVAKATQISMQLAGQDPHAIVSKIVALIEQRCALVIRRFSD